MKENLHMKIALASDHAGFEVKEQIKVLLEKEGYKMEDFGNYGLEAVDYPDFAAQAARTVSLGDCQRGILVCGSGIGMSIAANKIPGIRAALCHDHLTAVSCREHNDANILAIGARLLGWNTIEDIVLTFLTTPFSGEARHAVRIEKIVKLENN